MLLLHLLPLLLMESAVTADCKTNRDNTLKVTITNSSHLGLNWENAFKDCDKNDIKDVEVSKFNDFERELVKKISFDQKKIKVRLDPCLKHRVMIRLTTSEGSGILSNINYYNNGNIRELYAGDMKKIIKGICLKKNGTINIPVPERLKKCVVTKGDINMTEFQQIGDRNEVTIIYKDPSGAVPNIREQVSVAVSEDCSTTTAEPTVTEASRESDETNIILYAGIAAGVFLALVLGVVGGYCCWRKRSADQYEDVRVDDNPVYGDAVYYAAGNACMEMVDSNEDYYGK